ncbi:MAG: IS5 family transposase [Oscillatoria sp. PMC 1051.18]|nr:IS5 family transposase [Oscillatoria sp. PMC 1050.18]MEC5031075.1 IS5 family transposase [Oscillatoria sp. PMC 1051.18]
MYRQAEPSSITPEKFEFPLSGQLSPDNRWVIMAELIPWSEFEAEYEKNFSPKMGAPAKPFRMALGALIIKEKLGTSDRETVEQIRENPYLQYFLGMPAYSNEAPFEPSMFVHFRQRIGIDLVNQVNEKMVKKARESQSTEEPSQKKKESEEVIKTKNLGKLLADATCTPADIRYPNDLGLLNEARRQTEKILDRLWQSGRNRFGDKPRTYRKKARKDYLKVARKRRPTLRERRVAIDKQLQDLNRNLSSIEKLVNAGVSLINLSQKKYKHLLVCAEIYRQQQWMFSNETSRIDHRIVSLTQPHIRPIVRGKAGNPVEFGAKLAVSCFESYVFLDRLSWDNEDESLDLQVQIEHYQELTGYYPESVHVDKIYRTRQNRAWCKERGIRLSGPPLGRPPKNVSKETQKQAQLDERIRNEIEGKFGQGKRRYGLARIMAKLRETSETAIAISFLVINLSTLLRQVYWIFLWIFSPFCKFAFIFRLLIIRAYVKHLIVQKKLIFVAS